MFFCEGHGCEMPHVVQFINYNPITNLVSFIATCEECEEESYSEKAIVGFTASLPACEWDKITPLEDNPSIN
jgi:hypothetical protein